MIPGVSALVSAGLDAGVGTSDFDVGNALTDGAFDGNVAAEGDLVALAGDLTSEVRIQ